MRRMLAVVVAGLFLAGAAAAQTRGVPATGGPSAAPADAYLYIIWPNDGEVIRGGKFWLRMGLRNMGVAPAGVERQHAGHHHVLIDTDLEAWDEPIPNDRNHLHFGAGQTEVRLELPPGRHTLQLVLGDHNHIPFTPPVVSRKITITVPSD